MSGFAVPGQGWASNSYFQLAKGKTLAIPMSLHEATRAKLVGLMKKSVPNGIILIKGGEDSCQYDSDTEILFRQDSWFNYLFGVKESGVFGAISISTGKCTLFIPKLPEEYKIWCGTIHPPSSFRLSYAVDEVLYTCDMTAWFTTALAQEGENAEVHLMNGVNSDSGIQCNAATFEGMDDIVPKEKRCTKYLYHALSTSRVTKSAYEIEVMEYCAWVASNAHVEVMRSTHPGLNEYELEAKFLYEIYRKGGCRRCAYTSICACGPNGAVLHYGHAGAPNDRLLLESDMALLDMGAEYHGYVSDITCSFPVSGKFSSDQQIIYQGVLNAQTAVLSLMKPGVSWVDCHLAAEREVVKALIKAGILKSNGSDEDIQRIIDLEIGAVFLPHGLGHLIGCDTHDVGGYIEGTPARSTRPGTSKLRTARVLEAGMVLTNEPGCYFIDALLEKALSNPKQAEVFDTNVLDRFRSFGGVRLEDVVTVTENGVINLTTCPRTIEEVESVMAGGNWPPKNDMAPELKRKWMKFSPASGNMELLTL